MKIEKSYRGDLDLEKYKEKVKNKCGLNCEIFKFIIMDVDMPVMDGLEATK